MVRGARRSQMVRAGGDRLGDRQHVRDAELAVSAHRQGFVAGVQPGARGAAGRGQGCKEKGQGCGEEGLAFKVGELTMVVMPRESSLLAVFHRHRAVGFRPAAREGESRYPVRRGPADQSSALWNTGSPALAGDDIGRSAGSSIA